MEINIGVPENQRRQKEIDYILKNTGERRQNKADDQFPSPQYTFRSYDQLLQRGGTVSV